MLIMNLKNIGTKGLVPRLSSLCGPQAVQPRRKSGKNAVQNRALAAQVR